MRAIDAWCEALAMFGAARAAAGLCLLPPCPNEDWNSAADGHAFDCDRVAVER